MAAFSSRFSMPWSGATVTWRPSRLLIVSGSATRGVFGPAHAASPSTARVARRPATLLLPARIAALLCQPRAVIDLRHGETRLRAVRGKPLLLLFERSNREVLHVFLLLGQQRADARGQRQQAPVEF